MRGRESDQIEKFEKIICVGRSESMIMSIGYGANTVNANRIVGLRSLRVEKQVKNPSLSQNSFVSKCVDINGSDTRFVNLCRKSIGYGCTLDARRSLSGQRHCLLS